MSRADDREAPNPKHQIPKKHQAPRFKIESAREFTLEIGAWNFPGAWGLEFGFFAAWNLREKQ
jgi:hypothetical protein